MVQQEDVEAVSTGWHKRVWACMVLNMVLGITVSAQTATYNDVLVVINSNSTISDTIGSYFATVRSIPSQHIARISVPVTEEIDSATFENLRSQLETIITSRGIKDSINYIVTTKGMPLKVLRSSLYYSSSVESELTLILGSYASNIGKYGRIYSPYYNSTTDFTRAKYGIYLVTRLDGYTVADVKAMIDRASNIPASVSSSAQCVFDMDPTRSNTLGYLNTNMRNAATYLASKGISSVVDSTSTYLTYQKNVLGYVSWGSNDANWSAYTTYAIPHNTYINGAIAETYVSTSGRTFNAPATYGQSLIADLIAEGITAAKGYVYEPYSSAMTDVNLLFTRYADGFTVAESYYAATYFLSWMDVVIGDPKYRMVSTRLPSDAGSAASSDSSSALPVELSSFTAVKAQMTLLTWKTSTEENNFGFEIERRAVNSLASGTAEWTKLGFVAGNGTTAAAHSYSYSDANVSSGTYAYRLKQIDNNGSFKYSTEVELAVAAPASIVLHQNYPNPFNPSTAISFVLAQDGFTTLKIFDVLGREVATLLAKELKANVTTTVTFNASKLASGVYFSRLECNGETQIRKLTLMK